MPQFCTKAASSANIFLSGRRHVRDCTATRISKAISVRAERRHSRVLIEAQLADMEGDLDDLVEIHDWSELRGEDAYWARWEEDGELLRQLDEAIAQQDLEMMIAQSGLN